MKIEYASLTSDGSRDRNEDAIRIEKKDSCFLFALADGLGSYGNGRIASDTAVNAAAECFLDSIGSETLPDQMIRAAQEKVLEKQKENSDLRSMSTTLAVLYLSEEHAQWAHIGDSRIYWFQNGCLKEYTKDHSVPQLLVSLGQIRPDEVRGHPDQNRLLKVIGREWTENPFSVSSLHPLTGENHFLVCSDGFWEYIDERQMEQCLGLSSDPDQWLSRMDDTAIKQAAGMQRDNYSVICVRAV